MREFKISFSDVLDLPLKRFWFLSNSIDRLRAEENLRQLHIMGAAGDGEALGVAAKNLAGELGQVFVWSDAGSKEIRVTTDEGLDPEFDREGLRALKALSELREGHMV